MNQALPHIFNRELYLARQSCASGTNALHEHVAEELLERLSFILKHFSKALLISPANDIYTAALLRGGGVDTIEALSPPVGDQLSLTENHYDAIFNILDLQCVNDVPGQLAQMARALKPDGILMVAFFAGDTLSELRQSWLHAESEEIGRAHV